MAWMTEGMGAWTPGMRGGMYFCINEYPVLSCARSKCLCARRASHRLTDGARQTSIQGDGSGRPKCAHGDGRAHNPTEPYKRLPTE